MEEIAFLYVYSIIDLDTILVNSEKYKEHERKTLKSIGSPSLPFIYCTENYSES